MLFLHTTTLKSLAYHHTLPKPKTKHQSRATPCYLSHWWWQHLPLDPSRLLRNHIRNLRCAPTCVLVGGWTNASEKYARQIGSSPQVGVNTKNLWNHHLGWRRVSIIVSSSFQESLIFLGSFHLDVGFLSILWWEKRHHWMQKIILLGWCLILLDFPPILGIRNPQLVMGISLVHLWW